MLLLSLYLLLFQMRFVDGSKYRRTCAYCSAYLARCIFCVLCVHFISWFCVNHVSLCLSAILPYIHKGHVFMGKVNKYMGLPECAKSNIPLSWQIYVLLCVMCLCAVWLMKRIYVYTCGILCVWFLCLAGLLYAKWLFFIMRGNNTNTFPY